MANFGNGISLTGPRDNWHSMHTRLAVYLEKLRCDYRYILIDCPSLREAEHAVILAPLVDGVVMRRRS